MSTITEDTLIGVTVSQFRNGTHYQYLYEVLGLVKKYDPNLLGIQLFFDPFQTALNNEDTALERILKSVETERIANLDYNFDFTFGGMREYTHSFLRHSDESVRYAAENLNVIFDKYGNIGKQSYRQELAMSHNLLQELHKHPADIAMLKLETWMNAHEAAANELLALLEKRNEEISQQSNLRVKDARRESDIFYHKIVNRINAMINIHGKDYVPGFFNEFNTHATEYNNKYAQHIGRIQAND
jgi:hypothetical protein